MAEPGRPTASPAVPSNVWDFRDWRVLRGCTPVSQGCDHCTAERGMVHAARHRPTPALARVIRPANLGQPARWSGDVVLDVAELRLALGWSRPRAVHVAPNSDLFHEAVTDEEIAAVFGVMAACPEHTFWITTKRATRMRAWFAWVAQAAIADASHPLSTCRRAAVRRMDAATNQRTNVLAQLTIGPGARWPLPNVWLAVSVEDQAAADERVPALLATPAAVHVVVAEPLLGLVSLREAWQLGAFLECPDEGKGEVDPCMGCPAIPNDGQRGGDPCGAVRGPKVDWVVASCERGPGHRPCDATWLRVLRDQCTQADTPLWLRAAPRDADGVSIGVGSVNRADGTIEAPYLDDVQYLGLPGHAIGRRHYWLRSSPQVAEQASQEPHG